MAAQGTFSLCIKSAKQPGRLAFLSGGAVSRRADSLPNLWISNTVRESRPCAALGRRSETPPVDRRDLSCQHLLAESLDSHDRVGRDDRSLEVGMVEEHLLDVCHRTLRAGSGEVRPEILDRRAGGA